MQPAAIGASGPGGLLNATDDQRNTDPRSGHCRET
jgi:hypothetical protein